MSVRPFQVVLLVMSLVLVVRASAIGLQQPGAATAETLKLPSGPNSVRGLSDAAEVDAFSAQVKYKVPVELPGAVRGFRPALDFMYSGDLGNGPLGVGWSIGVPQLRRTLRLGVPSYTSADEIELIGVGEGGRIFSIGNNQWRVEGKGNSFKIEQQANGGFKVTDAQGIQYFFGGSTAARHYADTRVQAWLLDSVIDLAGQTITLGYTRDQNEVYLQSMIWGPNQNYKATLTYQSRPDSVLSYRRGYRVVTAQRLASLTIQAAGQTKASYQIGYDNSFPLSRVQSITELGRDGVTALPALRFSYGATEAPTSFTVPGATGWFVGQGVSFLDVDGDGVQDLLRMDSGINEWRRNLCGSFGPTQTMTSVGTADLNTARLMDLYGTSRPELVVSNADRADSRALRLCGICRWRSALALAFASVGAAYRANRARRVRLRLQRRASLRSNAEPIDQRDCRLFSSRHCRRPSHAYARRRQRRRGAAI
jgi:hypothetical protein